ncbi:flagellin [Candidatus Regiella insecticola]|nr:flagellin [Candidatus Regiella insecticola]
MPISSITSTNAHAAIRDSNKEMNIASDKVARNSRNLSPSEEQILNGMKAAASGTRVTLRNLSDATSMLQTMKGELEEVGAIIVKMDDLALQAANDTFSAEEKAAQTKEFNKLGEQLESIFEKSNYRNEKILSEDGLLSREAGLKFQTGTGKDDQLKLNLKEAVKALRDLIKAGDSDALKSLDLAAADVPAKAIDILSKARQQLGNIRAELSVNINLLGHITNSVNNTLKSNTDSQSNLTAINLAEEMENFHNAMQNNDLSLKMLAKKQEAQQSLVRSVLN